MAVTDASLGARVRTLRERSGMKSQDLARAVGIDPSAMSNIESGKRAVKTAELTRIATALGVSPLAILDESSLVARLPVSPRVDVEAPAVGAALERLQGLAELHELLTHDGLPAEPQLDGVPSVDVGKWKASAELLAAWAHDHLEVAALGDNRFTALADAIDDQLRVDVLVEDVGDGTLAGAAITDPSFPLVFVRASQPRPRALFTLAHELAHVLAGDGQTFTVDESLTARTDRERFANAFAATYLMPAAEVQEHMKQGLTPLGVAKMLDQFGVSYETLIYRLHNLGFINYQVRNELQGIGIRGLISSLNDTHLARTLLARLGERGGVETRAPTWLAGRALLGYQRGSVSIRPLAGLLNEDPDILLATLESKFPYKDAESLLQEGADGSEEERYSGSPV